MPCFLCGQLQLRFTISWGKIIQVPSIKKSLLVSGSFPLTLLVCTCMKYSDHRNNTLLTCTPYVVCISTHRKGRIKRKDRGHGYFGCLVEQIAELGKKKLPRLQGRREKEKARRDVILEAGG